MTRFLALPTGLACRICALCSVVVMLAGAAARAQSADPSPPPPAEAPSSVQGEATAACEPIGLTASGEIVFPFRCKDMIERQHTAVSKPADPKPAVAAAPPAVPEKPQAKPQAPVAAAAKLTAVRPAHPANAKPAAIHPAGAVPMTAKPAPQPVVAARAPRNLEGVGKTGDTKPADTKPADAKSADAKSADAKSSAEANAADARPAETKAAETKPVETTKSIPPVAGKAHVRMGPPGCTQFQSYNAASATYLGFDGQRHPCQEAAGQLARKLVAGNQAVRAQAPHKPSPADSKH